MGLFIAQTDGATTFRVLGAEVDVAAIAAGDAGIGFNSSTPTNIEGITTEQVTYNGSTAGPTQTRLNDLVNNVTYTSPPNIVIFAYNQIFVFSDGTQIDLGGLALQAPDPFGLSPLTSNVATFYDQSLCNGAGVTVDAPGGGTSQTTASVILYHELSHCFHFVTGTTAATSAVEELNATVDENDQRAVAGVGLRDINSRNASCGGGTVNCCIVATLATESAFSGEIHNFRRLREQVLRKGAVGDDFFENFFYHYYAFSPEVTRLMGREENLRRLVKDKFVLPLLAGVELLIYYAENKGLNLAQFLRAQSVREGLEEIHSKKFLQELATYLSITRGNNKEAISLALAGKGREFSGFRKLLKYVNRETIKNEFINWSIIDVLDVWVISALLLHSGKSDEEITMEIYSLLSGWIGYMPITSIWEEFSRLQTENELNQLEQFIFDDKSKEIFAGRLVEKHPNYSTTIRRWAQKKAREV